MNIERLRLLVTLLTEIRDNPKPNMLFDLSIWAREQVLVPEPEDTSVNAYTIHRIAARSGRSDILTEGFCGTTACAVGHACLDPRFIELGLKLDPDYHLPYFEDKDGDELQDWDAVRAFFDINHTQAMRLFTYEAYCQREPISYNPIDPAGGVGPQQVIDRINQLLEETAHDH